MTTAVKPDAVKPNNATPKRGKRNSMASTPPMDSEPVRHIGVGIDTARYGHRVNFLREDKQLVANPVTVTENREGYDLLRAELETLHGRHSEAMFHVHIDAAGQYSVSGSAAECLVAEQIVNIRNCEIAEKKLLKLLTEAFHHLPQTGHSQVITIPGIGPGTAAVLVAKMVDIERFAAPENVVGYFGIFPEEKSSGVDRKGRHILPGTMVMSHKGSDIVRRYLWNAAKSAIVHNPPVKALYARLRARGVRGDVALGHCMQKLLHLVFAVWSTDRPFDPEYEAKRTQAKRAEAEPVQGSQPVAESPGTATSDVESECVTIDESIAPLAETPVETTVQTLAETETTAGHNQARSLENKEATAVASRLEPVVRSSGIAGSSVPHVPSESTVDFSFVREQIGFDRVLSHLGLRDTPACRQTGFAVRPSFAAGVHCASRQARFR